MPARNRSRTSGWSTGTRDVYGSLSITTNPTPEISESCADFYGPPFGINALTLIKRKTTGGFLNGSGGGKSYDNLETYARTTGLIDAPASVQCHTNVSGFATKAAALSNPSRPQINLIQSIGELKDVPRMLRHAGRYLNGTAFKHGNNGLSAAKEVAAENLAIQFGWAPIISDLAKLAKFEESFTRRTRELQRLSSGRGLTRRIKLYNFGYEAESTASGYAWSNDGVFIYVTYKRSVKTKSWSVVRWKPTSEIKLIPGSEEHRRKLLGLTPSAIPDAAWELLPWSFLVDYFTNVGDYISLTNNHLLAQCQGGSIMTTKRQVTSWDPTSTGSGTFTVSGGSIERVTKLRRAFTPFDFSPISGSFPILSGKQLSILSSLIALRV